MKVNVDTNKGETMKTIEELDVELELLKLDIEKHYEVLSNLKHRKSLLLTKRRDLRWHLVSRAQ
jgi:hypothetical protein